MAEKALKSKLEDRLNCSICLDTYTDPKLLQCCHVFCQSCLGRLVTRNQQGQRASIICPACRRVTPIPGNGTAGLPSAFHVSQFLEILNEAKSEKPYLCAEHDGKKVDLYCDTCGKLICWKCIKKRGGKHHDHDYEELDDAVKKYKEEVAALLKSLEDKAIAAIKTFEAFHQKILNQKKTVEDEIHRSFRQLHEVLTERETKLLTQLDQISQDKQRSLEDQKNTLETTKAEILQLMVNESQEENSYEEMLMKKTNKLTKLKDWATDFQSNSLKPDIDGDVQYIDSTETTTQCQRHGKLQLADEEGKVASPTEVVHSRDPFFSPNATEEPHSSDNEMEPSPFSVMPDEPVESSWRSMYHKEPEETGAYQRYGEGFGWRLTGNSHHRQYSGRGRKSDKQNWRRR